MSVGIGKYLYRSPMVESVNSTYLSSAQFLDLYRSASSEVERKLLLRHVIRFNTPYVFKDCPLVYEQIRHYLSELLEIEVADVMLIGSAKTGFSMSTAEYGKGFSEKSDLDFTIVSSRVFEALKEEYGIWREKYMNGIVMPRNETEQKYWDGNLSVIQRNISRKFIDSNKLPNRECCPKTKLINDAMYRITVKIKEKFGISVSHASVRIYSDLNAFYDQFKLNTDYLI